MGYLQDSNNDFYSVDGIKINITDDSDINIDLEEDNVSIKLAILPEDVGIPEQCDSNIKKTSESDVVIGMDFGTSTTKVAVGDRQLKKSYAVPFRDDEGIEQYLIPSCLYVTKGEYSLSSGNEKFEDLKVMLLSNTDDVDCQIRVIAYWALLIRHIRSWIFINYGDLYKDKELFWTVSVGVPTVERGDESTIHLYEKLMACAWRAAGKDKKIDRENVKSILKKFDRSKFKETDPEIRVVPELAAQIYGFVVSNSFDEKAKNIYMMFDVGGGSLDSAIFHVKPGRGNRWIFSYFNAQVKPYGVLNLHRYRITTWDRCLRKIQAPKAIVKPLNRLLKNIGGGAKVPEFFEDYYHDVSVSYNDRKDNPDWIFGKKALTQVKDDTLCKAVTSLNMLSKNDVKDLSFYSCGGGSNMKLYQDNLICELEKPSRNASWLHANKKSMPHPDNLQADIAYKDYDRLSVAYGLSQIEYNKDKGLIWPDSLSPAYSAVVGEKNKNEYVSKEMI